MYGTFLFLSSTSVFVWEILISTKFQISIPQNVAIFLNGSFPEKPLISFFLTLCPLQIQSYAHASFLESKCSICPEFVQKTINLILMYLLTSLIVKKNVQNP